MTTSDMLLEQRKKYPTRVTRSQAIRLYCKLNCCAGDQVSWANCSQKACFLWPFRKGGEIRASDKLVEKNEGFTAKNAKIGHCSADQRGENE